MPLAELALKYDSVESHGWYSNLDLTVSQILDFVHDGDLLVDYSGGTGILEDRLFGASPDIDIGVTIVDASPKFLRLALEKFKRDERVAFRLIRYLKDQKRLQFLDEVFHDRADAISSTNAIHLYYDLDETLVSWHRALNPNGRFFVQSGNIRNPAADEQAWIIDETVESIQDHARDIVREDDRFSRWRHLLGDEDRNARYRAMRHRYFLPVRSLDHYVSALTGAGFEVQTIENRTIAARVSEWFDFLGGYHDGVLGWAGGVEKIEGRPPDEYDVVDRLALLRTSLERLFEGRDTFDCSWTYITGSMA